jgi:hypothetical protein
MWVCFKKGIGDNIFSFSFSFSQNGESFPENKSLKQPIA